MSSWDKAYLQTISGSLAGTGSWRRRTAAAKAALNNATGSWDRHVAVANGLTGTTGSWDRRATANRTGSGSWSRILGSGKRNYIRNNSAQGAVAGTPGTAPTYWVIPSSYIGINTSVVGTGIVDNVRYIDIRFQGVAAGGYIDCIIDTLPAPLTIGETWTSSCFAAVVGGTTANVIQTELITFGAPTFIEYSEAIFALTPTLTRFSATKVFSTIGDTGLSCRLALALTVSGAVDITIRLGYPQLEKGSLSAPIRTP